jgi:hypothetical protein
MMYSGRALVAIENAFADPETRVYFNYGAVAKAP